MPGDDWTVVGSKGRPRKPRRAAAAPASHSPAASTRSARRSAEAPADGETGGDDEADGQAAAGVSVAEPLPGWGASNGHGAVNGRTGRVKRRQAWVERSPAERVESLKRSVLEAKKEVAASPFYASLMFALAATNEHDAGSSMDSDGSAHGGTAANGVHDTEHGSSQHPAAAGAARRSAAGWAASHDEQQQVAPREDSHGSGSRLHADRQASGSPMATDTPDAHDALRGCLHPGQTQHGTPAGSSPRSYAAAAAAAAALLGTAEPAAANGHRQPCWRWADVRELVVYGLGSFESGPVPRCQLALTLLLAEAAGGRLATPPQLYDPAFTEVDKLLLREVGCALIARNEHGRRVFGVAAAAAAAAVAVSTNSAASTAADRRRADAGDGAANGGNGGSGGGSDSPGAALVYLAHCKPELGNALLDANWSPAQLASFAVIGNSMHTCADTWALRSMRRVFAARPSRVLAIARARAVAETHIPEQGFGVTGAFNDVAFHVVTSPEVAAAADAGEYSD